MDGWITDGWIDERKIDGRIDVYMYVCTDGWWMDPWYSLNTVCHYPGLLGQRGESQPLVNWVGGLYSMKHTSFLSPVASRSLSIEQFGHSRSRPFQEKACGSLDCCFKFFLLSLFLEIYIHVNQFPCDPIVPPPGVGDGTWPRDLLQLMGYSQTWCEWRL